MEILLFGITKDIMGKQKLILPDEENITSVAQLKQWLGDANSEVALLPPVSGG